MNVDYVDYLARQLWLGNQGCKNKDKYGRQIANLYIGQNFQSISNSMAT